MLLNLRTTAIAAAAGLAMLAAPVNEAQAFGQRERDFLKGAAATAIVGTLILNQNRRAAAPRYAPVDPGYAPVTRGGVQRGYADPVYAQPRHYAPQASIYQTPAARAFNAYPAADRRAIQRRLQAYGYYRGGIDGAFGPGTYAAITAYARDEGQGGRLASTDRAFGVYDSLIY